jgi:hypothetical protein
VLINFITFGLYKSPVSSRQPYGLFSAPPSGYAGILQEKILRFLQHINLSYAYIKKVCTENLTANTVEYYKLFYEKPIRKRCIKHQTRSLHCAILLLLFGAENDSAKI